MSSRVRRISIALGLLLAAGLLVGVVSADRLSGDDDGITTTEAVETTAPVATDPYPLSTSTTPKDVQLLVFERAYSECASTKPDLLASKYKAADTSEPAVAKIVALAWASYFKAGPDAVQDGLEGCLQGQKDRSS